MSITASHNSLKNSTRAKIIMLLATEGMMTTNEIAQQLGTTAKQIRDNSNQARRESLISSERDDITQRLGYKITPAGREWLKALMESTRTPRRTPTRSEAPEEITPAAEDRKLYVILGKHLDCPEIAGPTLADAQQQCISMAFDIGADLTLYRLIPVGHTRTSVTFVDKVSRK